MSPRRSISNLRTGNVLLARASVRASFFSRLAGLQFKRRLVAGQGALFVCSRAGRLPAAVHTLGMRSAIAVIWLDAELKVVDLRLAKPWRFAHVPKAAAMYYLEAHPSILDQVKISDQLSIGEAQS